MSEEQKKIIEGMLRANIFAVIVATFVIKNQKEKLLSMRDRYVNHIMEELEETLSPKK